MKKCFLNPEKNLTRIRLDAPLNPKIDATEPKARIL